MRLSLLVAPATVTSVAWTLRWDDLCTGAGSPPTTGAVEVPAGADRVDVVVGVAVPQGPAWALTATTAGPERVAATPVRVPATGRCP